nr:MAG TPA: hypothetical protein [Caudoviricetes sp.]
MPICRSYIINRVHSKIINYLRYFKMSYRISKLFTRTSIQIFTIYFYTINS